jgi:hypothetical protein
MKFYTDEHIGHTVVDQLQAKGIDIIHCYDAGMGEAGDEDHLIYATENERVMVSCDKDFLRIHSRWQSEGLTHAGILYFDMASGACKDISNLVRVISAIYQTVDYEQKV